MRVTSIVLIIFGCLGLSGCVSTVTVSKADDKVSGIRYFLPQVFIQVTPNQDGTVTVEKVYLPDPSNEYSISATSYLGNFTLDVNRNEKGFLETVSFNSDSTGVAKQLIQSSANLRAAEIDAQAAKSKAEATETKTTSDKAVASIVAAEKAQKDAQIVLDIAQRKLDLLVEIKGQPGPPSNINEQLVTAKLAVVEATVRRDAALIAYSGLITSTASANATATARPTSPEPAFFEVVMTKDNVALNQAFPQNHRETWKSPKTDVSQAELVILPSKLVVRPNDKTQALTALIKADRELASAEFSSIVATSGVQVPLKPLFSLRADKVSIDIELPKLLPAGDYEVDGTFTSGSKDAAKTVTRTFFVRVEK